MFLVKTHLMDVSDIEMWSDQSGSIHLLKWYQHLLAIGYLHFPDFQAYPYGFDFIIAAMIEDQFG